MQNCYSWDCNELSWLRALSIVFGSFSLLYTARCVFLRVSVCVCCVHVCVSVPVCASVYACVCLRVCGSVGVSVGVCVCVFKGMPVALLLKMAGTEGLPGFGWLDAKVPKLEPRQVAYIGLRDLDDGERAALR